MVTLIQAVILNRSAGMNADSIKEHMLKHTLQEVT